MAIFTDSKPSVGGLTPKGAVESTWGRLEPLIDPEHLRRRYLFGVNLVSGMKDAFTNKSAVMNNDDLKDQIDRAVSEAEELTHTVIMPTVIEERQPYDPVEFRSWGYMRLRQRPVTVVQDVSIVASDGSVLFRFDPNWVEGGGLQEGQLNILPLLMAVRAGSSGTSPVAFQGFSSAQGYLAVFGGSSWVPQLLQVRYTAGFDNGELPKTHNELIASITTINILSMLASTYSRTTGASLSVDSLSQSSSSPGPELFNQRVADLTAKRDSLVRKIKAKTGQTLFSGNV